ncbi:DNA-binding transcriptional repressor AcrR [Thalassovita gelatinovora]|uniref:DNA-binding transcriptional repressor AcrR n=1 Tax=Thalassovita gelatinovora TaxID=53501 RepID=A0A0N7LVZ6_THAGE|nr:TetR/AcrR family transcriptional regulator [Thalassovita gelatinovora]QIZ82118.1 TetR/AcrR family transcriptional regulator [Thalassovita gelatinovora]CUH67682.1 DNA-binding transcriptional repressor AcrR [Thalassovita gelatinovora]SEP69432.1 transcriptional regulator, TetR family [Thalassovita gelatinovora]
MSRKNTQTRTRILTAAWHLLETDGTVRMSDIAKQAGISRQALYLHFPSRAELLIATTRYLDEVKHVDERLTANRAARSGREKLSLFVEVWGNYIPEIHGVARALMAMQDSDEEARNAWADRMHAVREGCEAAVDRIEADGLLAPGLDRKTASDLIWTLLSVRNWEQLRLGCGWSQEAYIAQMKRLAELTVIAPDR